MGHMADGTSWQLRCWAEICFRLAIHEYLVGILIGLVH